MRLTSPHKLFLGLSQIEKSKILERKGGKGKLSEILEKQKEKWNKMGQIEERGNECK